jgi:hypothetical protein
LLESANKAKLIKEIEYFYSEVDNLKRTLVKTFNAPAKKEDGKTNEMSLE